MIVIYVTSRSGNEMATASFTAGITWANAEMSWGFKLF
ncbi:hypothetical protein FHT40_001573 [Mycolicibacterium sp. BK556]|nr:hypothetical protein [Mycolicibacterium sp. BK556]MBB3631692.1 hypothetical protein [Mycolicibacterium sp. BK607]MBB3749697.1 hypothetical protein [Mycolicibacterium sp. BK634]TDO14088.1 hypothetical protein EV580_2208 [Mycobacterium sp. BK086]